MMPDMVGYGEIEITRAQNRNLGIAEGFRRMTRQSDSWSLMLRYQAQSERMYRRAAMRTDGHSGRRCAR